MLRENAFYLDALNALQTVGLNALYLDALNAAKFT